MASLLDLNSDASDSEEDCDYVPPAGEVSENSDNEEVSGDEIEESKKTKKTRRGKKQADDTQEVDKEDEPKKELTTEEEKKRSDDLWQNFMKDVKPLPKKEATITSSSSSNGTETQPAKVTVTEVYEFAGEKVTVTKEVDSKSVDLPTTSKLTVDKPNSSEIKTSVAGGFQKRPAKGLSSVLGTLSKKQKLSTLQKTALDWKTFKQDEGLEEDLGHHNKGKEGFLEKQAFLQRSDVRQFEIEKNLRLSRRTKF